jgi:quinol monooxygenase YgiN
MSEPIVFISHFRVKEGKLDGLRRLFRDVSGSIQGDKPRTLAYLSYVDEDADNVTFVHVFADSASMDLHFEGADERSEAALAFLEPDGWEIYGTPSDDALEMIRHLAMSSGVDLIVQAESLGGFLRFTSAR